MAGKFNARLTEYPRGRFGIKPPIAAEHDQSVLLQRISVRLEMCPVAMAAH